jgi:hypothetical protein
MLTVAMLALCVVSCGRDKRNASLMLRQAAILCENERYEDAGKTLDSLKLLYPKDVATLKRVLQLDRKISLNLLRKMILRHDSLLTVKAAELESLKKDFILEKDPQYDDEGRFMEKSQKMMDGAQLSYIQCRTSESGKFMIASVFCGKKPINHEGLKVTGQDGVFAETERIPRDGSFNYDFVNLETVIETVTYVDGKDNGVAVFVRDNCDERLTAEYTGGKKYTYTITDKNKAAIAKTISLAEIIAEISAIHKEKDAAREKINYLEAKLQKP